MTERLEYLGVCFSCNQMKTCTSRKGFRGPVFYCEEFDDTSPAHKETVPATTGEHEDTRARCVATAAIGLCADCGNRASCSLSNTPGGIWHCEEYA
jgi:hypothetical protein